MQIQHLLLAVAVASVIKVEAQSDGAVPDMVDFVKGSGNILTSSSVYAKTQAEAGQDEISDLHLLPDITPSDLCQHDDDGDAGGICNDKLTGKLADDNQHEDDSQVHRRATPAETLDFLCESAGETKVGFCNSNLPIAQTDEKNKTPLRREDSIQELVEQLIPRHDGYRRSTSTVHLCSRSTAQDQDLLEIRGYPGLCKRINQRDILPSQAVTGSEKGAVKAFEGSYKGYKATEEEAEYSLKHPDTLITAGYAALQSGLRKKRDILPSKAINGSEKGTEKALKGSYVGYKATEEEAEYSLKHPDTLITAGYAALQSGLKKRQDSGTGASKALAGSIKGFTASEEQTEYSLQHPDTLFTAGAAALESGLQKRQYSVLLPCVKDESSSDEAGFCDSIIPSAEERDIVEIIRRTVHYNAHRRFAKPQVSIK